MCVNPRCSMYWVEDGSKMGDIHQEYLVFYVPVSVTQLGCNLVHTKECTHEACHWNLAESTVDHLRGNV